MRIQLHRAGVAGRIRPLPERLLPAAALLGLTALFFGLAGACLRPSAPSSAGGPALSEAGLTTAEGTARPRPGDPALARIQVQIQERFAAYLAASPPAAFAWTWTTPPSDDASGRDLLRFYELRAYAPAWFDGVTPRPQVFSLLAALDRLGRRPLGPAYPVAELERELDHHLRMPTVEGAYELDLAFSHAYLATAFELLYGRLQPREVDVPWYAGPRRVDLAFHLAEALSRFEVEPSLLALLPSHEQVRRLEEQLVRYRRIVEEGGWPQVPAGPTLQEGDAADPVRTQALIRRLAAEGHLTPAEISAVKVSAAAVTANRVADDKASSYYTPELARAVAEAQQAYGLQPDGKLGPATLAQLNVPAAQRLAQIEVNLIRWHWVPEEEAPRAVVVNIPAYRLEVVEGGRAVLTLRVMVGKKSWPTPTFDDEIEYAVLNPAWNVPASIARREILPQLGANPEYLAEENLVAYAGWEGGPVAAGEIDLAAWRRDATAYRLRQPPGSGNPLGRVKLLFPNRFHVYLHDTSARHLFASADRAVSHGCIRVEQPFRLAEALFREDPRWGGDRLEQAALQGERRTVRLPRPVPVSLRYFTAHVREDGRLELYRDVYGIDAAMIQALEAAAAAPPRGYAPGIRVTFTPPRPAGGDPGSPAAAAG